MTTQVWSNSATTAKHLEGSKPQAHFVNLEAIPELVPYISKETINDKYKRISSLHTKELKAASVEATRLQQWRLLIRDIPANITASHTLGRSVLTRVCWEQGSMLALEGSKHLPASYKDTTCPLQEQSCRTSVSSPSDPPPASKNLHGNCSQMAPENWRLNSEVQAKTACVRTRRRHTHLEQQGNVTFLPSTQCFKCFGRTSWPSSPERATVSQ